MEPPDQLDKDPPQASVTSSYSSSSSSSSSPRRSISTHRSSKGALRLKSQNGQSSPALMAAESHSASDEQSLTSFPSLSPSLENPPEFEEGVRILAVAGEEEEAIPSKILPQTFQHLFTPALESDDRSTLFIDAPQDVRDIPGTLHLQPDDHVRHLIHRVGSIKLVKRLARDLAQRDAHVTLVQRKAEEREMLLRKMLRECEVSNLDIENRLKELDMPRKSSAPVSVGAPGMIARAEERGVAAAAPIHERLAEALSDEADPAWLMTKLMSEDGDKTIRMTRSISGQSSTSQQSGTIRDWKSFFKGGNGTIRKASMQAGEDSDYASSSGPQTGPGSPTLSRKTSRTPNIQPPDDANRPRNGSDSSTASVTGWLRIVAGKTLNGRSKERAKTLASGDENSATGRLAAAAARADLKSRNGTVRKANGSTLRSPRDSVSSGTFGPHGTLRKIPTSNSHQSIVGMVPTHSPQTSIGGTVTNLGPVEMDTILPEDTRPPTLTQALRSSSGEFLTDNFGFIYDQRKRRKFNEAANTARDKNGSAVEILRNHRGDEPMEADEEVISIGSARPETPASTEERSTSESGKNWQDYLKLSNFKTELLSHTPSAGPITDIVASDQETVATSLQAPISVSKRGSVPAFSKTPIPSTTRAVSENAELVTPSSGPTSPGFGHESDNDPVKALVEHLAEVHSQAQRVKTVKWNEFLRKVRAERRRDVATKAEIDAKSRGAQMPETLLTDGEIIGIAGLGIRGKVGKAKGNEFKNLVLAGIPTAYRAKIWAECSGALSLRVPGYYEDLTKAPFVDDTIVQQIQMDIPRTLTDNIYYRRGAGVEKLKEVLLAYARRNPDIGYCQGMNLITANLLLIMPTAEDAFWVLTSMVENILPQDYYSPTLLTSRADQVVLRRYVADILPLLSNHLDNLGIELEALTFQWFLSVFTDCLSAEALFRVWDVVLCLSDNTTNTPGGAAPISGTATFLFQVALALLKLNEKSLMACENPAEVYRYINRGMTDHAISIDNLIRASEGLRKEVRTEEVLERRRRAVEDELEMMRKRESIRKGKGRAIDAVGPPESPVKTINGSSMASEETPRAKTGRLTRESSMTKLQEEDEVAAYGELTMRTPMPIDEEAFWRA